MFDLSERNTSVALLALAVALSGCSTTAKWKLHQSTDAKVLQCISEEIDVCSDGHQSLVSGDAIGPELRIETLRSLASANPVTLESVAKGYTLLRELSSSIKSLGKSVSPKATLQAKFNIPSETLDLFARLIELDATDSTTAPAQASISSAVGAKSAMGALVRNNACVELSKIRDNSAGASGAQSFNIGKESFRECLQQTQDATTLDGWSALSAHYVGLLIEEAKNTENSDVIKETERIRLKVLVKEALATRLVGSYMKAYFNNGSVFSVDLRIGHLKTDAVNAIKKIFIPHARRRIKMQMTLLMPLPTSCLSKSSDQS